MAKEITLEEFENQNTDAFILVDVRGEVAFSHGSIPGAVNVRGYWVCRYPFLRLIFSSRFFMWKNPPATSAPVCGEAGCTKKLRNMAVIKLRWGITTMM